MYTFLMKIKHPVDLQPHSGNLLYKSVKRNKHIFYQNRHIQQNALLFKFVFTFRNVYLFVRCLQIRKFYFKNYFNTLFRLNQKRVKKRMFSTYLNKVNNFK